LFLARSHDGTACLKIVDFGISKVLTPGEGEFDMTRTGTVMGSPYYMSPEQMRSSRSVDARADIWSLGIILYELVAGRVPFDAPTLAQLCGMILTEPTPRLADARKDTPPRFATIVSRCLEKEPNRRFQNVGELAAALAEFAPPGAARSIERILRLGGAAASGERAVESAQAQERPTSTDWGRTSTKANRSRGIAGALAALVVVVGAGSWALVHKEGGTRNVDSGSSNDSAHASAAIQPVVVEPARSASAAAAVVSPAVPVEAVASAAARSTVAPSGSTLAPHPPVHTQAGPKHPLAGPATAVPTAPTTTAPKGLSPLDGRL
jgi:serine/threonine-protein kinase